MKQKKAVKIDGVHTEEVLGMLAMDIRVPSALDAIRSRAATIISNAIDPAFGPQESQQDGLLYGLIQSGKTSIITVAAAMAVDNGFQCVVVLTSDIDLLYDQTLERLTQALRGLKVLGKNDWREPSRFNRIVETPPFVLVCSKNSSKLNSLLDAFKFAKAKRLSALIIDDEADQASLNTKTRKQSKERDDAKQGKVITNPTSPSAVNAAITELRKYFGVNTYLQVTATPQALFLQAPKNKYRPSFTVLSEPGPGYHGGEVFFAGDNRLLVEVDIDEVNELQGGFQPNPTLAVPKGLRRALLTFFVGAAVKVKEHPGSGYAFLCHVSMNKNNHAHVVDLVERYLIYVHQALAHDIGRREPIVKELEAAYQDISQTHIAMPGFQAVLDTITRYLHGAKVRLINASSSEEIRLDSVFNIFVGGNKLGRGVTIQNLIVSYYGRNPKRPNADTVLQHARMYGYRDKTIDVTRLFLPKQLADHFRMIHQMERGLREVLSNNTDGKFVGLYIHDPMKPTKSNVLDPTAIGMFTGGGYVNPSLPDHSKSALQKTEHIDKLVAKYEREVSHEVPLDFLIELVRHCESHKGTGKLWNPSRIALCLENWKSIDAGHKHHQGSLYIKGGSALKAARKETAGVHTGGEDRSIDRSKPLLMLFRVESALGVPVWWPTLRWPEGNYAFAFSLED